MNNGTYLSDNEFQDYVKIGVFAGETRAIADKTPIKEWAKDLRIAAAKLEKIARARVACLDEQGLIKAKRKVDHSDLRFVTSDEARGRKSGLISYPDSRIVIEEDDFLFFIKLIDLSICKNCNCGNRMNCDLRKAYIKIGREPENNNPQKGECEYKEKENK